MRDKGLWSPGDRILTGDARENETTSEIRVVGHRSSMIEPASSSMYYRSDPLAYSSSFTKLFVVSFSVSFGVSFGVSSFGKLFTKFSSKFLIQLHARTCKLQALSFLKKPKEAVKMPFDKFCSRVNSKKRKRKGMKISFFF